MDEDVVKYHKETIDLNIPSYRKLKEIVRKYTPAKRSKTDFFKEKIEAKNLDRKK